MEDTNKEKLFTRAQLIADKNFEGHRDIICALLAEDEMCSVRGLNRKITAFLSKKTN